MRGARVAARGAHRRVSQDILPNAHHPSPPFTSDPRPTDVGLANLPPGPGEPRPGFVFCRWAVGTPFSGAPKLLSSRLGRPRSARQHHTCTVPSQPLHSNDPSAPSARDTRAGALRRAPSSFGPKPIADRRPASHPTFPDERGGCEHESANTPRRHMGRPHTRRRVERSPSLTPSCLCAGPPSAGAKRTQMVSPRSLEGRNAITRAA